MSFTPSGGFPPIIPLSDNKITNEVLNTRGFSTNIVSIGDIMDSKKKENLFLAFGSEDENGIDFGMHRLFTDNPNDYSEFGN